MNNEEVTKKVWRQKAEQYKTILENLHEGYLLVDEAGHIYETNAAYCNLTGYTKGELYSMTLADLRPGLTAQKVRGVLHTILDQGSRRFESRHQRKDGKVLDLNVSAAAIERDDGFYIAGMVWDITEEKETRRKFSNTKKRFQSLFEHNPHSVYIMDLKGNYQSVNSKLEALSGYSENELLALNYTALVTDDDLERTSRHFKKAVEGKIQTYEITGITKDGQRKPLKVTNFPMIVDREIVGVFGIAEDITEAHEAEKKLKESEERWHGVVENNPECVIICIDGNIQYINRAGAEIFGYENPQDVIGHSQFDFAHPDDWDLIKKRDNRLKRQQEVPPEEQKIIDVNGREKNVIVHSVYIRYKGRDAIQSVLQDFTDQKRKEQIIQNSLHEKEIMLQEIHHRVKNNMAVVSGLLELQSLNTTDQKLQVLLKESQMRIRSMAMIHEKLYASHSLAKIDFSEYAKDLVDIIHTIMNEIDTALTVRYRMDSINLNINQAIPCGLILNELITNCYKHAFSGQPTGTILIGFTKRKGTFILSVEDNGKGMPPDVKTNNNKGLGTTVVQTLSRQLDGEFNMETGADEEGTCVEIRFPAETVSN